MLEYLDPRFWFRNRRQVVPRPPSSTLENVRQETGGWPGAALGKGTESEAYLTSEKIHSGPPGIKLPVFLPYMNDVTGETAQARAAYRLMLGMSEVKASFLSKILDVAALDLRILPADKKNKKDQLVAEFVEHCLTISCTGGVAALCWSILSGGLIDGFAICEKVLVREQKGRFSDKIVLSALKAKDVGNDIVLEVDDFRNVVGVRGTRYNSGTQFAPSDFLIYRHLPLYESPVGMSDFRSVYPDFWLLDSAKKLRAVVLERKTIPVAKGTYKTEPQRASLEAALADLKSRNYLVVPDGVLVELLNLAGSADDVFKSAIADLTHSISRGITGAVLQSLEGTTREGAGNSQVHRSTADLFVWFLAATVTALLNDRHGGLIKDLVDLNFAVDDYPRATLSAADVNELNQELQIDTGLHAAGLDLSKEDLYERYGRRPPHNEEDKIAGQAAPGGVPPGGPGGGPPGAPPLPFADVARTDTSAVEGGEADRPTPFADDGSAKAGGATSTRDLAPAGADGQQAEQLLRTALKTGTATLGELVASAVKRLPANPRRTKRLFNAEERQQLADALAATNATAELLGRARVRRRMAVPRKFAEQPTDFSVFAEPIRPQTPESALAYFRSLIPMLGVKDPGRWAADQHRVAFTLAEATEQILLERIQRILAETLAGTHPDDDAGAEEHIEKLLDAAGVSPNNPGYAENVVRTNLVDAYNTGTTREMQDPDVSDYFPAWQYLGIRDGRQRKSHEQHFDRYYPNSTAFAEVRDSAKGAFDGFRCRCTMAPVSRPEWEELTAGGTRFATFSESPRFDLRAAVREFARDLLDDGADLEKFCQEGPNKGKPGVCPEGGTDTPAAAAQTPQPGKLRALLAQAGRFPAAVWAKAKGAAANVYKKAEAKYGPTYAKAIVGAFVVGLPLPGGTLLPAPIIAAAMLHKKLSGARTPALASHAEADVPAVRQSRSWTCGPAALAAVARRFGRDVSENELAHLGNPEDGTLPVALFAGARQLGLDAEALHNMTVPQLERHVIMGQPVLLCLQMHGSTKAMDAEESGHWVVATGRRRGGITLMDPATGKTVGMDADDLPRHWRDRDVNGVPYRRFGIVIRGPI